MNARHVGVRVEGLSLEVAPNLAPANAKMLDAFIQNKTCTENGQIYATQSMIDSFSNALTGQERETFLNAIEKRKRDGRIVEMQGNCDPNAKCISDRRVKTGLYRIEVMKGDQPTCVMNGLAIGGTWILIPKHFIRSWIGRDYLRIRCYGHSVNVPIDLRRVREGSNDYCVYDCGPRFNYHKDIRNHFISENDLRYYTKGVGQLVSLGDVEAEPVINNVNISEMDYDIRYGWPDAPREQRLRKGTTTCRREGWQHNAQTSFGDCGSVLIGFSTRLTGKLLGIHVAGVTNENLGWAILITREMLHELLPGKLVDVVEINERIEIDESGKQNFLLPEGYEVLGTVQASMQCKIMDRTDIMKSVLYDRIFDHTTEPSVMKARDMRNESGESPMRKALKKYVVPTVPFDNKVLDVVEDMMNAEVLKAQPLRTLGHFDIDEITNGLPIEYYDRINPDSSTGWPFVKMKPKDAKPGKRWIWTLEDDKFKLTDPMVISSIKMRLRDLQAGTYYPSVWTHCLKDERRSLEKIRQGSTRIFTMAPVDITYIGRIFFMDYIAAVYNARIKMHHAVGIDPLSPEWTALFNKLNSHGGMVFGIDWSKFDGTLDPECMWRVKNNINHWYDVYGNGMEFDFYGEIFSFDAAQCNRARDIICIDIIHTTQIVGNVIHRKHQGEPSGVFITVVMNGDVNKYYLVVGFIYLSREHDPIVETHYFELVKDIVYGDDAVIAPHLSIQDWFNYLNFSQCMKSFGLICTPADKGGNPYALMPLTDVTFLKRRFLRDEENPSYIRAPLDYQTTFEMINWIRKCDDLVAACLVNCDCSLREAVHLDFDIAGKLYNRINEELMSLDLRPVIFSRSHERQRWLDSFY